MSQRNREPFKDVRLSVVRLFVGKGKCAIGCWMLFLGMISGAAAENPAATRTTLTVSTDSSGPRTRAALTAHIEADSAGMPSGVVNFRSGETDLGSAVVDSEGNASLQTDILPAGRHEIVAVYQGQSRFLGSTSRPELMQANVSTVAGFTVAASPTSLSTNVGSFVNTVITVTPNNGFNGYIALSCSGLPVNTTCTFTPTNVPASCTTSASGAEACTAGSSVMQIQTQSPSPRVSRGQEETGLSRYAFALPMLFGLAGFGALGRRRKFILGMLAFAAALGMTGCAQRYNYLNHGPPGNPGTPAGTYTITVQASSSSGAFTTTPPALPQITLVIKTS
jgi:Bacterial Ig-like domain (group 3)